MSDFVNSVLDVKDTPLDWLTAVREQGRSAWRSFSMPNRKTENWKYTNLSVLEKQTFEFSAPEHHDVSGLQADVDPLASLDAMRIVFVDGRYSSVLSDVESIDGLSVCCFEAADENQKQKIAALINSSIDYQTHGFASLNTCLLQDGVFIALAPKTRIQRPLHIVWLNRENPSSVASQSRVLVDIGACAELTLIEHFLGAPNEQTVFTNAVSEFFVGDSASMTHYRLHEEHDSGLHIGSVHSTLAKDARLDSFYLALGAELQRLDVVVNYTAPGAESTINGVYLPNKKQHVDIHTTVEHRVPHCQTSECFRGIIGDEARAVFNGRIHIHKDAQKTEAFLSNKNLLTSNKAEVDTKPELEIYADDVRCAHGATVAQLDDLSLHYLTTRGISEHEAKRMLSYGFINELISGLKHPAISEYCLALITDAFFIQRPGSTER